MAPGNLDLDLTLATPNAGGITPPASSATQRLVAVCGDSIAAANQWSVGAGSRFPSTASLQWANMLSGSPLRFPRMTANTRTDRHGIYGYSGARLDQINTDMVTNWFAAWDAAGLTPDLIVGLALCENSLGQGQSAETIKADLDAWIALVQGKWPGKQILICTPHLSYSYNTAHIVTAYQSVRDYILAKDTGQPDSPILATRIDVYEQPGEPGVPAYTNITASISGTKMTVTAADGEIVPAAALIATGVTAGTQVRSYDTGRGGTGDYNVSASQTVSSRAMKSAIYTDSGPHPNAKGALLVGRAIATTFARIARAWINPFSLVSNNLMLTGSGAATGTNVSGTKPSNVTFAGAAAATFVLTALQPGYQEAITGVASVANSNSLIDLSRPSLGSYSAAPSLVSPYAKIEMVSGAANIKHFSLEPRILDGGGNNFQQYLLTTSDDAEPDFVDGDILTIVVPPLAAGSGSISSLQNYVDRKMKLNQDGKGAFTYRVLEQGFYIVA